MKPEKRIIKDLALQRILRLLSLAEKIHDKEPALADRYGQLAMALARRARLGYPDILKIKVCRKCGSYMVLGKTQQVRIKRQGKTKIIVVKCLKCGYTRRYHLTGKHPGKPWKAIYLTRGNIQNAD